MVTHREYQDAVETIEDYIHTYYGEDYIYRTVESDLQNLLRKTGCGLKDIGDSE